MHLFQSTLNTRPVLENSLKFIRSDVPANVSEKEKTWLLSNNVTTIIDLRTDPERSKKPCPLQNDSRFSYHIFTLAGGDSVPGHPDDVSKSYIAMVDERFDALIGFLLNADTNVLYFCNAGKDRTGVVSAVLLHTLGKPREYIVDDYLKSKQKLAPMLNTFARQHPDIDRNVIMPHKRYIEEFLNWYIGREKP